MNELNRGIAETFRQAELERRQARRQMILNNAALVADEVADDAVTRKALATIRAAEARRAAEVQEILMSRWTFWTRLRFLFTRRLP